MSFDHQEADLAKLKEYMLSAGHRQKVQAAANALRTALTNILTVQGKIESLGKVPDDQVDHVKATIVGYTEFQDLVGMVAGLDQTSQIVERVQRKLLATPLMPTKARNAVKNPFPAAAASSAIPVDEYATDDEEAEAQDPSGTFLKRMSRDGVSQVEAAAALADIQRMQPMNAQGGCGGGYDRCLHPRTTALLGWWRRGRQSRPLLSRHPGGPQACCPHRRPRRRHRSTGSFRWWWRIWLRP